MATEFERELVENNKKYAATYDTPNLEIGPSKKAVFVTCMDSRLDPLAAYGFKLGEVVVLRNAGASARDAQRSVLLTNHLLGTREVLVVKHTRCGLLGATDELAHGVMKQNLGLAEEGSAEVDAFEVIGIQDLEESARQDVAYLRGHGLALPGVKVTGWIQDTDTGLLRKVVD